MTTHDITLTATLNPADPAEIIITGNGGRNLPKGSGSHHFKFELDDKTTKNVKFASLTAADNCSTCPPDTTKPNTQIVDVRTDNSPSSGQPRRAEFKDKNDNKPAMDVSYQWEFTCDPTMKVSPFDPTIVNGGKN